MERILQWMDDFEDLVYLVMMQGERVRRLLKSLFFAVLVVSLQAASILMALENPSAMVAIGSLVLVAILYRGSVYHDIGNGGIRRQVAPVGS